MASMLGVMSASALRPTKGIACSGHRTLVWLRRCLRKSPRSGLSNFRGKGGISISRML